MSNTVTVTLEVDARPAEAGISAYERQMQKLAAAAEKSAAINAKAEAAMGGAAGGVKLVTEATERASRSWSRLQAAVDPAFAAHQRIERAANQAAAAIRGGAATYDQAAAALDKLRAKQEALERTSSASATAAQDAAKTLRMTYDTAYASAVRYAEVEEDVRKHIDARTLTIEEGNAILSGASARFKQMGDGVKAANDNVRLTGDQVRNLGFQLNDAATMLASGSSPFQVIATQAGQVVQALQDGPGGLRGSLAALWSSVSGFAMSLGPAGLALGGLAAAAGAFALITRRDVKPIEDIIAKQAAAVRELRDAYGLAADAAEDYVKRSPDAIKLDVSEANKAALERARQEIQDRLNAQFVGRDNKRFREQPWFDDIRKAFNALNASAADGAPAFAQFEADMAAIIALNFGGEVDEVAKASRQWARELIPLQTEIVGTNAVMDEGAVKAEKMAAAYRNAMAGLSSLIPDLRTDAERINAFFDEAVKNSTRAGDEMVAKFKRQQAMTPITDQAQQLLDQERAAGAAIGLGEEAKAVAEVNTRYAELTKQYKGNTDALVLLEQWRDQAIANAGKQTAFDADQEGAKKAEAAAKRATAEAERYAGATRSRMSSIDQTVASLRMEAEALGQSEGAAAATRFQFQALAAAKQAAAGAGTVVSPEEIAAIQKAAGEVGVLTDQISKMREAKAQAERLKEFMGDLDFDVSIAKLPEVEQEIQRAYRDLGVTAESVDGQRIASNIRYLDSLENTTSGLLDMRDIAEDVATTLVEGFARGEDVLDGLIGTFARLGQQLASAGLQRLMGGLFGTGQAGQPAGGFVAAAGQVAGAAAGVAASYGAAPVGQPQAAAIGALNDNLNRSAKSALDVARQFEGLNERADSKVLDSFMQASGSWRNLSASDTAWCAAFANAAITQAGGTGTGSNLASSFLPWGTGTNAPQIGDIVVLKPQSRGASGHVGFVAGFGDGTVQVFGGNQSNGVNTKSFGLDQVAGYRTGIGLGASDMARAVEIGSINATKKVASGGVPGVAPSAWGPQFDNVQNISPNVMKAPGGGSNMLRGALGGVGLFASGYQSADPLSGALGGAMGGLELAPLLGATGPVGAIIGAGIGLLGGLLGGRSKKKEEKRQKQMAADAAWSENYPALLQFSDEVNRVERGALSQRITDMATSLKQFEDLAKATNSSGNRERVEMLRRDMESFVAFLTDGFRDSFEAVSGELAAGLGIDGPFSKARDAVLGALDTAKGFIEDTKTAFAYDTSGGDRVQSEYKKQVAAIEKARRDAGRIYEYGTEGLPFGGNITGTREVTAREHAGFDAKLDTAEAQRDAALAEWEKSIAGAKERYDNAVRDAVLAAREGLLRLVSGDIVEQSDIVRALAEARGAAAGLDVALRDLGMSAEEAGVAIDHAMSKRMDLLRETFTRGLQDRINELDGKGYIASFRDLIKERDTLLKDASLINVDTSLVSTFFAKQAQSLVDGAELAGEGFTDLIKLFPELSGVVKSFADDIEDTLREIRERIEGYDERRFSAMEDTSTLAGAMASFNRRAARERLAEGQAGGQGMFALDAALAAEKVATIEGLLVRARQDEVSELDATISRLKSFSDGISDMRDSLKLDADLSPLNPQERYLEAQKQFRELQQLAAGGDEDAQGRLASAWRTYMEESRSFNASTEAYYADFAAADDVMRATQTIADQQLATARSQLDVAKAQLDAMQGVEDGVAALLEALKAAQTAAKDAADRAGVVPGGTGGGSSFTPKNELEHFLGVQYGAILGRAPDAAGVAYYQALRDQGATADQLIAYIKNSPEAKGRGFSAGGFTGWGGVNQVAGAVHGQEYVFDAAATRAIGVPMLDQMREARRIPVAATFQTAPRGQSGDEGRAVVAAIGALERQMERVVEVIFADGAETREEIARGNRIAGRTQQAIELDVA